MSSGAATTPSSSMIRISSANARRVRSRTSSDVDGLSPCCHSAATSVSTTWPLSVQVHTPGLRASTIASSPATA